MPLRLTRLNRQKTLNHFLYHFASHSPSAGQTDVEVEVGCYTQTILVQVWADVTGQTTRLAKDEIELELRKYQRELSADANHLLFRHKD